MSFWDNFFKSVDTELPDFQSLDQGVSYVMKYVKKFSERLNEPQFYVNRRWKEVRDDVNFQENLLHVFKDDGEYWRILEGDIAIGSWELEIGGMVLRFGGRVELYELVFLNERYIILKKHGDPTARGQKMYWFLATESIARRYTWPDMLTMMYDNIYKDNTNYLFIVVMFFVFVAVVLFFSL